MKSAGVAGVRGVRSVSSLAVALLLALVLLVPGGGAVPDAGERARAEVSVTLVLGGSGVVTATSGTASQTCDPDEADENPVCDLTFEEGSSVTFVATPDSGKTFEGWSLAECTQPRRPAR